MENTDPAVEPVPQTNDVSEPVAAAIDAAASEVRERAFLHDDPAAYRAGARDALAAFARLTDQLPEDG